jgi:hypothetical protein
MAWTAPYTWPAALVVTAAKLNEQVRDNFKAIGDPWTAWTPTWTAGGGATTLGNGTLNAAYSSAGKLLRIRINLALGSTTSGGTGGWSFTLPPGFTAIATHEQTITGKLFVASANWPAIGYIAPSATSVQPYTHPSSTNTTLSQVQSSATAVPGTWVTGNILHISGAFEVA